MRPERHPDRVRRALSGFPSYPDTGNPQFSAGVAEFQGVRGRKLKTFWRVEIHPPSVFAALFASNFSISTLTTLETLTKLGTLRVSRVRVHLLGRPEPWHPCQIGERWVPIDGGSLAAFEAEAPQNEALPVIIMLLAGNVPPPSSMAAA